MKDFQKDSQKDFEWDKNYDANCEDELYQKWEKDKIFEADLNSKKESFTIAIPPPNVTAQLHVGHSAFITIQDIIIRYKKSKGFETLWIPGTDHAAIATQNVVEKILTKDGKTISDFSRDEFLMKCWDWSEKTHKNIQTQIKKMGASLDFSREKFTLEPEFEDKNINNKIFQIAPTVAKNGKNMNLAVQEIFLKMWDDGLIYRGERMINWCPRCLSTLSDEEVEHQDFDGKLYFIKYPIENSDEFLEIATTRPETMLGDTAIAVNPDDKRYTDFIGKFALIPLKIDERKEFYFGKEEDAKFNKVLKIPIIADNYVDSKFGTGALKITPLHDKNDFDIGMRNNLKMCRAIGKDGLILDGFGKYSKLSRFSSRKKIISDLQKSKHLIKIKNHFMSIGHCYRCDEIIEPMSSKQFFVNIDGDKFSFKKSAIEAVKSGAIKIIPKKFEKTYFQWLDKIHDWCISRQILWGHRIPVWLETKEKKAIFARHGQSKANEKFLLGGDSGDPSLTKQGQDDARELAKKMIGENVKKVIVSGLKRSQETGKIVADNLGLDEPEIWDDIFELDIGKFNKMEAKEVFGSNDKLRGHDVMQIAFENNEGEGRKKLFERATNFVEKIKAYEKKCNGNILFVSHALFLYAVKSVLWGSSKEDFFENICKNYDDYKMFNCNTFEMKVGNIEKIHLQKKQNIHFIRHGESEGNIAGILGGDPKLTEKGKKQIKKTVDKIIINKISDCTVISSPRIRAKQSSEILINSFSFEGKRSMETKIWEEIKEINFGKSEGKKFDCSKDNPWYLLKDMDLQKIEKRAKKFWQKIEKIENKNIFIFAHKGIISALFAVYEGKTWKDFVKFRESWEMKNGEMKKIQILKNPKGKNLKRSQDTLDTWFSSALWPFSILGWPNKTADFKKFYPNAVLETGYDILFFWVLKMIMVGKYATGKYPFNTVYLHGLVCDEFGKKMSKSKGNGIDPNQVIKKYGADPLRLSLVIGTSPGNNMNISEKKIGGYRNYINKIWNASRFCSMRFDNKTIIAKSHINNFADAWILSRLTTVSNLVDKNLQNSNFSQAGENLYLFFWREFCDVYLEVQKKYANNSLLKFVLEKVLKLLHFFAPFVTEKIWKNLGHKNSLFEVEFPMLNKKSCNPTLEKNFEKILEIATKIKNMRANGEFAGKEKSFFKIINLNDNLDNDILSFLWGCTFSDNSDNHDILIHEKTDFGEFIFFCDDFKVKKIDKKKELMDLQISVKKRKKLLGNKNFVDNAPEIIIKKEKEKLQEEIEKIEKY